MKNIFIVGPGRGGKTTLAQKINEELNYYVIHLDYLMTTLDRAYPHLDIWIDTDSAIANLAPFIGHFLAMSVCYRDFEDGMNLHKHVIKGNRFVMEGGHIDFDKISSVFRTYEIGELKDNFILIGLVQHKKTAKEFFNDLRKYDTKDEWTHDYKDGDLMELCELIVKHSQEMYDYCVKYGFTIYDTSTDREQVFAQIIEDIKAKLV